ncbi:16S rRNA (guanine(527)-N(7))-methyltransferase RsmG [Altererythrobacter indicus]|uniref:Ribosomal RNA small subunit methyltransferase G n=2 Tax=Altericroceibacterium indicum TaxID=374177 RepID=A0A845AAF0_9SPHN|nr:16S rRNA (guanine(527)-N(7))-methyltransferase RsmG [Altericroceibacterium indicum]MXP26477.1 16S rRNA (guanine(527)-N(7))-methyltransferase RsmG [Altericroceibacterium indicum]
MIEQEDEAKAFCASLTNSTGIARLERFAELLKLENEHQNLVAKASLETIWQRHFADSAQLLNYVPRETSPWLDLGTGAGFPGIVIAAMKADCEVVVVESRKRRIEWLERLCDELELTNCHVEGARLEQVESFEARVISARAFAPLPRLLELSARFSSINTTWVLPKGRSAAQELSELKKAAQSMFHVEQSVTDRDAGIIVGKYRHKPRHRA